MVFINSLKPLNGETLEQYKYRLYKNKNKYNLTWNQIKDLILEHFQKVVSSDFCRHEAYGYLQRDKVEIQKDDGYTKVLIINDLHIPYVRSDIYDIIKKHRDVDYILIAGDFMDCLSCSSFPNLENLSVEEELVATHEFLCKVNEIIDPKKTKIIAIRGNHEYRYKLNIMKMQEKNLQKLLNPKLLQMLVDGFRYFEKNKTIEYKPIENFQYIDEFYVRLFDNLIICHPTDFTNVDGRICERIAEYFLNNGIAEKEDVIITAHTHKFSQMKVNRRQGVFVIENMCLCQEHEYAKSGKLSFNPQNYGYTVLKFKDGEKINLNNIRVYHLK